MRDGTGCGGRGGRGTPRRPSRRGRGERKAPGRAEGVWVSTILPPLPPPSPHFWAPCVFALSTILHPLRPLSSYFGALGVLAFAFASGTRAAVRKRMSGGG